MGECILTRRAGDKRYQSARGELRLLTNTSFSVTGLGFTPTQVFVQLKDSTYLWSSSQNLPYILHFARGSESEMSCVTVSGSSSAVGCSYTRTGYISVAFTDGGFTVSCPTSAQANLMTPYWYRWLAVAKK